MSRFFYHWHAISISLLLLSTGCAAPIETRVQSQSFSALPVQQQYRFSEKPEQDAEIYGEARSLVAQELKDKGFAPDSSAKLLVHIALSDRPASIAIAAGQDEQERVVAAEKGQKFLQSCKDREHSLKILMLDENSGKIAYSGTAAEFHCKGTLQESLPHLVDAAFSELGQSPDGTLRTRSLYRRGKE